VRVKPSLIVHGGAGSIAEESSEGTRSGIRRALEAGWKILANGGAALDAVEAAIATLEDDPFFNAGTGGHLNRDGCVQLDAIIMDGASLKAGAVAAVERIRNPIRLARLIQDKSPHMLLVAAGAETFAVENGFALCDPEELITERARATWRKYRQEVASFEQESHKGTVGAVALDSHAQFAAGTSTGGTPYKFPGRVGDSPLIGCGCYADAGTGGVSCTGDGEGIMKIVMAKTAVDLLRDPHTLPAYRHDGNPPAVANLKASGTTIAEAVADAVIRKLAHRAHSTGGLILLDREGHPAVAFNTPAMAYGYVQPDGSFRISP
jgi:beta-aspartyl-peptidase (threonine type)